MIQIGKKIYNILSGDTILNSYIDNRLYPIIIPFDTPSPVVVYERKGTSTYTRDGRSKNEISVDFTIYSDVYIDGVYITQRINDLLENYRDGEIKDIMINNIDEMYDNIYFIQKISFDIIT